MTQWRLQSRPLVTITDGGSAFGGIHSNNAGASDTEADIYCRFYTAFTFTDLRVNVITIDSGGMTSYFRAAGSDTSVAVALSGTGWVEDLTDSATITANDLCVYHDDDDTGMHGDSARWDEHMVTMEHASIDAPSIGAGMGLTTLSSDRFWPLTVFRAGTSTASDTGFRPQRTFTLSNLFVNAEVLTGTWDFAPSIGATQSTSVIVALSGTGITEDTTGTQAIGTSDDDVNVFLENLTAGNCRINQHSLDIDTPERPMAATGHTSTVTTIKYSNFTGELPDLAAEDNLFQRMGSTEAAFLQTSVPTAPGTGDVTFRFGSTQSSNLTIAVTGTGFFEDLTGTETVADGEATQITAVGVSGGIRPRLVMVEIPSSAIGEVATRRIFIT